MYERGREIVHCKCTVQWHTQDFFFEVGVGVFMPGIFFEGASTNSVEDRDQRERGCVGAVAT
jgi:hypothetical protein